MSAIGSVWSSGSWLDDVWLENTWANASAAVVTVPPYRAEMSVTSRAPTIGVTSRRSLITVGDA